MEGSAGKNGTFPYRNGGVMPLGIPAPDAMGAGDPGGEGQRRGGGGALPGRPYPSQEKDFDESSET